MMKPSTIFVIFLVGILFVQAKFEKLNSDEAKTRMNAQFLRIYENALSKLEEKHKNFLKASIKIEEEKCIRSAKKTVFLKYSEAGERLRRCNTTVNRKISEAFFYINKINMKNEEIVWVQYRGDVPENFHKLPSIEEFIDDMKNCVQSVLKEFHKDALVNIHSCTAFFSLKSEVISADDLIGRNHP